MKTGIKPRGTSSDDNQIVCFFYILHVLSTLEMVVVDNIYKKAKIRESFARGME
jgi:hypothetical protein